MARVDVTFNDGPLGLGLADSRAIVKIVPGGAAAALGVQLGDIIVTVGERDVSSSTYDDILAIIKETPRPMRVVLERPSVPHAAPADSTRHLMTGGGAVKAAARLMKGMLTQSVSAVKQGLDKATDAAALKVSRAVASAVTQQQKRRRSHSAALFCSKRAPILHPCAVHCLCCVRGAFHRARNGQARGAA